MYTWVREIIKDLLNKLTESACVTTVYHLRKQFVLTFATTKLRNSEISSKGRKDYPNSCNTPSFWISQQLQSFVNCHCQCCYPKPVKL